MTSPNTFDVIVIGAGPVGLTLANLLGVHGIRTLVIERNDHIEGEPRAVTIDDESLRTMQSAGLAEKVVKDVVMGYGVQYFAWNGKPLASIQPTRQEYGYPKRNAFRQAVLVRTLADGLRRFPHVEVRFSHELMSFEQGADSVTCTVKVDGELQKLEASWLVGCDGGRSKVRELCGVVLDGSTFAERWLIVDLAERTVPLRHTRTYCDPRRPAIRLPGPAGSLRYEFMLRPGDKDEDVLVDATFREWIRRRVPEDADLPLVRKVVYGFHARVANSWKQGRVLLAGDAAHLTPPFAGQGLNSGIRDATNLAWKLAAIVKGVSPASLMDSYEPERKPHAAALIKMALRIGSFMQPKTIFGAALAQAALRTACLIPACRDYILQLKFKPKPQYSQGAFIATAAHPNSELLPQPIVEHSERGPVLLDEVLGNGFSVIGFDSPLFRANAARFMPRGVSGVLSGTLRGKVVAIVRTENDFIGAEPDAGIERIRDTNGDLTRLLDRHGAVVMVVRPDRYWSLIVDAAALAAPVTDARPDGAAVQPSRNEAIADARLGEQVPGL
ncbi:bifunctional 3-(3-hydroxy-phenyl)propionate/3-hydroxycinnamic acid hydroxylase [soil metagenome]